MTNRDFVSQVRSMHRLLSADNKLNDRTILREGMNIALVLIKRETDKRKLFQSPNLFTVLPCLEMEEVPLAECCDYTSPLKIARSTQKLPKIADGVFGLIIQHVASVDGRTHLKETTPTRYANILKLKLPSRDIYYWIYQDHLWITNPDTKATSLSAFFEEPVPNTLLYPTENCCGKTTTEDPCLNPLDQPFRCPGYLLSSVMEMVSKKLLEVYHQLPQDTLPDGIDGTTKNT
jgi:hypothetical protein